LVIPPLVRLPGRPAELPPRMEDQLAKEVAIPVAAFVVGAALLGSGKSTGAASKLAMFFGAQAVMNLYMKDVLSMAVVSDGQGFYGVPAAFGVTAIQQLVAFALFGVGYLVLRPTPCAYTPQRLSTPAQVSAVLLFSLSYALDIALNNYSLELLPLSVNLIIRSLLPLATFVSQVVGSHCAGERCKPVRPVELLLMFAGVLCTVAVAVAKSHSEDLGRGESEDLIFGAFVCVLSIFAGAINLAMAGILGTSVALSPLDTTIYMSAPAMLFLLVPTFAYRHPVGWPGHGLMTDWEVLAEVFALNPGVLWLALVSGVLALLYNMLQYGIVQNLSASYTAFAGNFNKATTVALSLLMGVEALPPGGWGVVTVLGFAGDIGAFTAYNVLRLRAARRRGGPPPDSDDSSVDGDKLDSDAGSPLASHHYKLSSLRLE